MAIRHIWTLEWVGISLPTKLQGLRQRRVYFLAAKHNIPRTCYTQLKEEEFISRVILDFPVRGVLLFLFVCLKGLR